MSSCKKIFCYTKNINTFPDKFKNKIIEIKPLVKEDIYKIENALEKVNKLRGVHFTRKATKEKEIGVVANEVEKIIPELVNEQEDAELGTIKTMKYANTVGLLIEAVKELSKQVEELKK